MALVNLLVLVSVFTALTAADDSPDSLMDQILQELKSVRFEMAEMKENYDMRIEALEETVAQLTKENVQLKETDVNKIVEYNVTDELEERIEDLETTVVELDKDIDNINADINILQADVSDIGNDIEDIELRMDAEEDRSAIYSVQIASLQLSLDILSQTLADLEDQQNRTNIELSERIDGVENQLEVDIVELQEQLQGIGNYYFMAHIGELSRNVTDVDTLIFDVELINEGGHYNSTTGAYTAPVDGVFYFKVEVLGDQQERVTFYLRVDGQRRTYTNLRIPGSFDQTNAVSILVSLNTGQTVDVENNMQTMVHGSSGGELYSWFAGCLLRAT